MMVNILSVEYRWKRCVFFVNYIAPQNTPSYSANRKMENSNNINNDINREFVHLLKAILKAFVTSEKA